MSRRTLRDETHPAFFDRALALGIPSETIQTLRFAADRPAEVAATLLGLALDRIAHDQSEQWRQTERVAWRDRHRRAKLEARRRETPTATRTDPLAIPPVAGPVVPDLARLWLAARDAAQLHGVAAAAPQLAAILDRSPGHPGASVLLGQHLLSVGDADGERLLWAVADLGDEQWTPGACQALEGHYRALGRPDLQRKARDLLDQHESNVEKAREERNNIGPGDRFGTHDLPPEPLGSLQTLLSTRSGCVGAWLARKAVHHFPGRPVFVLAVRSTPRFFGMATRDNDAALVRELAAKVQLPGRVLVVSRSGGFRGLARAVESIPGTRIFPVDPPAG